MYNFKNTDNINLIFIQLPPSKYLCEYAIIIFTCKTFKSLQYMNTIFRIILSIYLLNLLLYYSN